MKLRKVSYLQDKAEYTISVAVVGYNGKVGKYSEITSKATIIRGNFFTAFYQKLSKVVFGSSPKYLLNYAFPID